MKRMMMRIALLALALCLCAPSALAVDYEAGSFFTISYDESLFTLDSNTYSDENVDDTYYWFFILYDNRLMFDVSMTLAPDCGSMSLFSADDAAKQTYLSSTLDAYSDENAQLVTCVQAGTRRIPFYLFQCSNEYGPYLRAETVVKGYAVDFMAYYNDSALPIDDELTNALIALLNTFEPAA